MRLSVSNIAWETADDRNVYEMMKQFGYTGLEIAPTRIFKEQPYECLKEAKNWKNGIEKDYGFCVPSMQSIWFGKQEKVFGSETERQELLNYTKKAIDFAAAVGCGNLVFGCPRNRFVPEGKDEKVAIPFFRELGEYALSKGTVVGMEANPPIYNTNYINDTLSALDLIEEVNSKGFLLNLDVGTMIQNGEDVRELEGKISFINHVHISEPGLKPIEKRELHLQLANFLKKENYSKFVSVEMGKQKDVSSLKQAMAYVKEVFGK